jgi:TetR/AcrR family transcriptional regulator, transcriptional repressor for nem operon
MTLLEAPPAPGGTANRILDTAELLVQTRGFNDFSYADIALELGVTKAALHYHFRSKTVLGDALIARYSERFFAALDAIEAGEVEAGRRLARYVALYRAVLAARRMCLCGILAAEYQTLPDTMRTAVRGFFDHNEVWLERVLDDGAARGELVQRGASRDTARMIVDTLEGAVMVARAQDDPGRLDRVAEQLLSSLVPSGAAAPSA